MVKRKKGKSRQFHAKRNSKPNEGIDPPPRMVFPTHSASQGDEGDENTPGFDNGETNEEPPNGTNKTPTSSAQISNAASAASDLVSSPNKTTASSVQISNTAPTVNEAKSSPQKIDQVVNLSSPKKNQQPLESITSHSTEIPSQTSQVVAQESTGKEHDDTKSDKENSQIAQSKSPEKKQLAKELQNEEETSQDEKAITKKESKGLSSDDEKATASSGEGAEEKHEMPPSEDEKSAISSEEEKLQMNELQITFEKAQLIVQHTLFNWIKASIQYDQIFKSSVLVDSLSIDDFQVALSNGKLLMKPIERLAFPIVFASSDKAKNKVNGVEIHKFILAKIFPVELLEFQLRKTIMDKATKVRGKCDVAKTLSQLVGDVDTMTTEWWQTFLVEKLALSCPAWVPQCVFCRILSAPLAQMCPRKHFLHCLDQFVRSIRFDGMSVECVFRQLVNADFEKAFRSMDTDKSGTLSIAECTTFLQSHNVVFPDTVLSEFLKRFDKDGDGTLSLDEFLQCCRPKQQSGVHVQSAYGFFYLTTTPTELMSEVVARIHKRMFWLQHNHLLGDGSTGMANTKSKLTVDTAKVDIRRHFGAISLTYSPSDVVQNCLANGELLVVAETDGNQEQFPRPSSRERYATQRPPPLNRLVSSTLKLEEVKVPAQECNKQPPSSKSTSISSAKQKEKRPKPSVESVQYPENLLEWTSVDVKKWLIYDVQVKSLAHKFALVDGKILAEWSCDPQLEVRLREQLKIHPALQRHKLVKRIRDLAVKLTPNQPRQSRAQQKRSATTRKTPNEPRDQILTDGGIANTHDPNLNEYSSEPSPTGSNLEISPNEHQSTDNSIHEENDHDNIAQSSDDDEDDRGTPIQEEPPNLFTDGNDDGDESLPAFNTNKSNTSGSNDSDDLPPFDISNDQGDESTCPIDQQDEILPPFD